MSWNGAGVYTRGYASWSNDAASNLPISATKFDLEDNDFAGGINNALCKDGQNSPTAALTWTIANAAPLTLLRQTDGTVLGVGRANGTNNPVLQVQLNDGQGATLNLTTAQQISFAIQGTTYFSVTTTAVNLGASANTSSATIAGFYATTTGSNAVTTSMRAYDGGPYGILGTQSNHALQLRTNDTPRVNIDVNGSVVINQSSAGVGLTVTAANGTQGLSVAGFSLNQGISVSSGFAELLSSNTTATYIGTSAAAGSGSLNICTQSIARIQISSAGAIQINPPATSGTTLYVAGYAGANIPTISIQGSSTAGVSNGLFIQAGNGSSADRVLDVLNYNGTSRYFGIFGDGTVNLPNGNGACSPAYAGVPVNTQTGNYQTVLSDANKAVVMNSGSALFTAIPANSTVAYPIGTVITVYNLGAATNQISNGDSMYWAPSGATGTRNISAKGIATLLKVGTTSWVISGTGLS